LYILDFLKWKPRTGGQGVRCTPGRQSQQFSSTTPLHRRPVSVLGSWPAAAPADTGVVGSAEAAFRDGGPAERAPPARVLHPRGVRRRRPALLPHDGDERSAVHGDLELGQRNHGLRRRCSRPGGSCYPGKSRRRKGQFLSIVSRSQAAVFSLLGFSFLTPSSVDPVRLDHAW
jgi:hypothetical protein